MGISLRDGSQPEDEANTHEKLELELELRLWQRSRTRCLIKLCLKSYLWTFQLGNTMFPSLLRHLELHFPFLVT